MHSDLVRWLESTRDTTIEFWLGLVEFSTRWSADSDDESRDFPGRESVAPESPFTILVDLVRIRDIRPALIAFAESDGRAFRRAVHQFDTALFAANEDRLRKEFPKFEPEPTGRVWWLFEIRHSPGPGSEVIFYDDLALELATRAWVVGIETVPGIAQDLLERFSSLEDLPDASEDELEDAMASVSSGAGVAVYDVGQGNCNAICDASSAAILYYDFGHPLPSHAASAPNPRPLYCFSHDPPMVLSHWDFDHWGAAKLPKPTRWLLPALGQTWIAPRQYLGPMHLSFAAAILAHGTLRVWGAAPASIYFKNGHVHRCTGPNQLMPRHRNDTGLALVAHESSSDPWGAATCLLTGDADFQFIPLPSGYHPGGMVVPHHGGGISGKSVPRPSHHSQWLGLSVGSPNHYGHPTAAAMRAYRSRGWGPTKDTSARPSRCAKTLLAIGGAIYSFSGCSLTSACCNSPTQCTMCVVQ